MHTVPSNTQADIEATRDAAGPGGVVFFPPGDYVVDGLEATQANQKWVLSPGTRLVRSVSTTGPILKIVAPLDLEGGILDGGRGANINPAVGIDSSGQAFSWTGGVLKNVPSWGIAIDNAEMTLRDLKISNIKNAGIIWRNTTAVTRKGPLIQNVIVDRSGEDAGTVTSGGILLHASAGKWIIAPRVIDCEVMLPQSSAYDPVCIELFNTQHARVIGNKTLGGRIGISFSNGAYGVVMGNIVQLSTDYAFEFGDASLAMNVQGNNATGYGPSRWGIVASVNSTQIRAIGNSLAGFTGALSSGMSGNSNVCWYAGSSFAVNYGN